MLNELKTNLEAFQNATNATKNGNEEKQKYGPMIAELIRQAVTTDNTETLQWLEVEKENKNPGLKFARAYVSKGFTVGHAIKSGLIQDNPGSSVSTLYDKIKTAKVQQEKMAQIVADENRRNLGAMEKGADLPDGVTFEQWFVSSSDDDREKARVLGLQVILDEQAEEQAQQETADFKAFLDKITEYAKTPAYFDEIQCHVLDLMEKSKAA